MRRRLRVVVLLGLSCVGGLIPQGLLSQEVETDKHGHDQQFWKNIVKEHYAVPSGHAIFPLARELSVFLGSPNPELRDDLAYSILYEWIAKQKKLSPDQLLALLPDWEANLRAGIGETGTDSVFKRSFSVLCLAAVAERDVKDPFLNPDGFRTLLEDGLMYLRDEQDLRGFDAEKGWLHATAHTADLLAALAENRFFTKQDQKRVWAAISQRLASANEIFTHSEQDRLADVAANIVSRRDFDIKLWRSWLANMDQDDQAVFEESPPKVSAVQRFENDTYFLQATYVEISLRAAATGSTGAKKAVLAVLRRRSSM